MASVAGSCCRPQQQAQAPRAFHPAKPSSKLPARNNLAGRRRQRCEHINAVPCAPQDLADGTEARVDAVEEGHISSCGRFSIRMLKGEDMHVISNIQANAFHTPLQPQAIDKLSKNIFKAEVLSALRAKMQSAPTDTFAILVATPTAGGPGAPPVAVLELFLSDEAHVLKHIPPAAFSPLNSLRRVGYGWCASMAVDPAYQRTGCATALLAAAHETVSRWNYGWTALHVYEDNAAARALYLREGYREVSVDPFWRGWLGGKRRVLMIREQTVT